MIRIAGVSRRFPGGVSALEAIDLVIEPGAFLVLLGPSGCGKSTLLRLLAGLDTPTQGHIEAPADIGMVFQEPTLLPWATALENAALPLRLRGEPAEAAAGALGAAGLAGFESARPATLSGGMKMRVALARALVRRPALLLLDEPFAALDEFTRHALQDQLRTLAAEAGCTCVFVTHSLYEAGWLATRVAVMTPRPGRIAHLLELGPPPADRLSDIYADRVRRIGHAIAG